MSVEMKQAMAYAHRYDRSLKAGDKRFKHTTIVLHELGSVFVTDASFLVVWKNPKVRKGSWGQDAVESGNEGKWVMVFAEHHEPQVFPICDLLLAREYGFEQIVV